jgi:hypothetical protein
MRLLELLHTLALGEFRLGVNGEKIEIAPFSKLSDALRAEILRFKPEILEMLREHGDGLLPMFEGDLPSWPASRGRDGILSDPAAVWGAIGQRARLKADQARGGELFAVAFDTQTGALRCRLRFSDGGSAMVWPEEVEIEEPAANCEATA